MLIREATLKDASGIARVHVHAWRSTYRDIVPGQVLENLSKERNEQYWHDLLSDPENQTIVLVAEHPYAGVVGFASAGPERTGNFPYQAELYTIYMLKTYQGRGVGRNLLTGIAQKLLERDMSSMLVWVLRDNLFRAFYEALGGQEIGEQEIKIGDANLIEVGYGWKDIHPLATEETAL
jgi:ribosomal protein S18 acetylase RimI-like enzyme